MGVGIFYAPADIARAAPGWASVLVFGATGLALAPVALAFALLGRRFDEDGGPVVYARAAFGDWAAFVVGWVAYVSAVASTAAVLSGLASAVAPALALEGPLAQRFAAAALATLLALVCAGGIALSARAWSALTVLKLIPLVTLAAAFLVRGAPAGVAPTPPGHASLLHAALTVAFTYQGFEIVPVIAGEVRSPSRAVPFATLGSLAAAAVLYVVLQAACVLALPGLASSASPLTDAAAVYGGPGLAALMGAGASLSALGISMGMMVTTPRYLSALARGGSISFELDRMAANGVPLRALGVTWLLAVVLVLGGSRGELFDLAAVSVLMQYVVTSVALGTLAARRERGLLPRHAWVAPPAILAGLALSWGATGREWLVAACAAALGLVLRLSRRAPRTP